MAPLTVHRRRDAGLVGPGLLVERERRVGSVFLVGEVTDLVVEAGDGHPAVGVGQLRQHPDEDVGRIVDATAVLPGVHVVPRAVHPHLPVGNAPQAIADGRRPMIVERVAVTHHAHVGPQKVGVIVDELLDRLGADLLVSLEEEAKVDRDATGCSHPRLEGLEMHEELPLVVSGAPRVHAIVLVSRLERRSNPFVEGVDRLDVVVAVDEHGRRVVAGMHPLGSHDRVMGRLMQLSTFGADAGELVHDPLCRAPDLVRACRIGRDALDAEELVQHAQVIGVVLAKEGDRGTGR